MTSTTEQCTLPSDYSREVLNEILKNQNFQDGYKLDITAASSIGENYLGEIFRINVTGKKIDSDEDEKFSLVLKAAPSDKGVREYVPVTKVYKTECLAYSTLQPALDKLQINVESSKKYRHPKFYKGSIEEFKEMIFLEDMNVKGFKLFDRLKPLDYVHAKLVIRKLAAYHATSLILKQKDPVIYQKMIENASKQSDYAEFFDKFIHETTDRVIAMIEDEECLKRLTAYCVGINEKLNKLLDADGPEEYSILCHGDCWTNNMLFMYEEGVAVDMCMLDWQMLRLASPITDIAYFIFSSTDRDFRQQHLEQLFDLYHETLSARVADMGEDIEHFYPERVFRSHIKNYLIYGLIMSMVVIPFTQSERGNAPDVLKVLKNDTNEKNSVIHFTEDCKDRLRDVVSDFVAYGMI